MIGIIDYGMGNLRSVQKGFERAGFQAALCSESERLAGFDGLVLPGVGAFGDAMRNLRKSGLDGAIIEFVGSGRQLLGICLGMQLLFTTSEEHGAHCGLGLIEGEVLRLPRTVKTPHMGWNVVSKKRNVELLDGVETGSRFYFVHSYYCAPSDETWVVSTTPYGLDFASAVGRGNIWGLQYHPEKSSALGLRILGNFGRMVEGRPLV